MPVHRISVPRRALIVPFVGAAALAVAGAGIIPAGAATSNQSVTATVSAGSLNITAPATLALGGVAPGTSKTAQALGTVSWTDTLNDNTQSSVTVQATDICSGACTAGTLRVPVTSMTVHNGQTVAAANDGTCLSTNNSGSAPTAPAAAGTTFTGYNGGTDSAPGTTLALPPVTLAQGSGTTEGCWSLAGSTIDVNFPAGLSAGSYTGTITYTVAG